MSVDSAVGDGLRDLRNRLPQALQEGIEEAAQGLPWTTVLREVDRRKGRERREADAYSYTDIQVQLRMLTERLAALGYPYDDEDRTVSILAGELRTVRNLWAHTHEFSAVEAFRALDSMSRLLNALGDEKGSVGIERKRNKLIPDLLEEIGIGAHYAEPMEEASPDPGEAVEDGTLGPSDGADTDGESEVRVQGAADRSVKIHFQGTGSEQIQVLGEQRVPFDPWTPVHSGPSKTLDNFRMRRNAELVQSVAEEIVEAEGPIREQRLALMVLRSFGRKRFSGTLYQSITRQLTKLPSHRDHERFYWPSDVEPTQWEEFRPTPDGVRRDFDDISAIELRNAARQVQSNTTEVLTEQELKRAVLAVFGFRKLMSRYERRLDAAVIRL